MRFARAPLRCHHDYLGDGRNRNLSLVVGKRAEGIVRRKQGTVHGFEILEMTPKIREQLLKLREGLPLFQSMIDI
jgi:hypothetical protein